MLRTFLISSPRRLSNTIKRCSSTATSGSNPTTVDQNEVSHFKTLKDSWWDEMGTTMPLHTMNKLRIPLVRDGLIQTGIVKQEHVESCEPLKHLNILDVGCGGGILSESLTRLGCNVTGIDATSELIEVAKYHSSKDKDLSNLQYLNISVEEHAISNAEKYDAVVASEVIEHVSEKDVFIENCVKCLKPGGSIFFTTLNKTLVARVCAIMIAENVINMIPKGTHEWDKFISPHTLQRHLENYKCRTKMVHGMWYNFVTNSWHWLSDTSISYALHAVKIAVTIGIFSNTFKLISDPM